MVQSLSWAADCSMLAAMQDTRFSLWYYPAIIYVDRSLLSRTMVERDSGEFGKYPVITSFQHNSVSVRRGDGSLVTTAILHSYADSHHCELCIFVKDNVLWSCLAGMAVHANLDTVKVAYAANQESDKVYAENSLLHRTSGLGVKEGGFQPKVLDLEDQRLTASNILPSFPYRFLFTPEIYLAFFRIKYTGRFVYGVGILAV